MATSLHVFSRSDVMEQKRLRKNSVSHEVQRLLKRKEIVRVGRNRYVWNEEAKKYSYEPMHSEAYQQLEEFLHQRYPLADYVHWELCQLNEFMNHQFGKNLQMVDVEPMLAESVFDVLVEQFAGKVLYRPDRKTLRLYLGTTEIIVKNLITLAPHDRKRPHAIRIEKLIVDLFADKVVRELYNLADLPEALEQMFDVYAIDETTMFRYASRRNAKERLRKIIEQETNIHLLTERNHDDRKG